MGRFDDRVVIVTGAARGQGEAEARLFAAEGATVVLADVLDDEGRAVAADIGGAATYAHLDVSNEEHWAEVVATATGLGRVAALVNNAGILRAAALEDTTIADYMAVVTVNQVGCFLGMRSVIAPMRDGGGGAIVNISSIDGLRGTNGMVGYTASKWAIRGMTKSAATELGRYGIRVNSVHPGGVNTVMGNPTGDAATNTVPYRFQAIPRIGECDEIARAVAFLASDEASYVTGAELAVDGGTTTGRIEPGLPGSGFVSGTGYNT